MSRFLPFTSGFPQAHLSRHVGLVGCLLLIGSCTTTGERAPSPPPPRQATPPTPGAALLEAPGVPAMVRKVEIRRTSFGVPHILAESLEAAAFGLAWVMMEDYREEVPRQLLAANGRWAAVSGPGGYRRGLSRTPRTRVRRGGFPSVSSRRAGDPQGIRRRCELFHRAPCRRSSRMGHSRVHASGRGGQGPSGLGPGGGPEFPSATGGLRGEPGRGGRSRRRVQCLGLRARAVPNRKRHSGPKPPPHLHLRIL